MKKYLLATMAVLMLATSALALTVLNIIQFSGKGTASVAELEQYEDGSITANTVSSGSVIKDTDGNTRWVRALITLRGTGTLDDALIPTRVSSLVWLVSRGADCDVTLTDVSCTGRGGVEYGWGIPQVHGNATLFVDSDSIALSITDPVTGDVLANVEAP